MASETAGLERNWRGKGVARFASGAEIRFGRSYEMEVDPAARKLDELPVLTLLGGYTMAMITAQRAAAS